MWRDRPSLTGYNKKEIGNTYTFVGGVSKTCQVRLSQISRQNMVSHTSLGKKKSVCQSNWAETMEGITWRVVNE